jgi:hypothetical protein
MSRSTVKLCPHCVEIASALHACGVMLEAGSKHHAIALVRAMKAEGIELFAVIQLLELLENASELDPPLREQVPAADYVPPLFYGRGETNV